jgi:transcriptional regulator GlxA family with amidase domain
MPSERIPGFRLGIYVFKDAEIVDFAAPHGVFSVARRFDPELDAFLIADAMRPVQTQAGFTVMPNYCFSDRPAMDAFLIPGGFGTRQEMHNRRLFEFIESLPESTLLTSVCTGSWIYGRMGLLDGVTATNRKEPDRAEQGPNGKVPIDRLADIAPACTISRSRVVDAGRIVTAGGITASDRRVFDAARNDYLARLTEIR